MSYSSLIQLIFLELVLRVVVYIHLLYLAMILLLLTRSIAYSQI